MPHESFTLVVTGPSHAAIQIVERAVPPSTASPVLSAALTAQGRLEVLLPCGDYLVLGGASPAVVAARAARGSRVAVALPPSPGAVEGRAVAAGAADAGPEGGLVLTPGGRRRPADVHDVPTGSVLRPGAHGVPFVDRRGGTPHLRASRQAHEAAGRVLTPGGFRPPGFVHRVLPGHAVDAAPGRVQLFDLRSRIGAEVVPPSVAAAELPRFCDGWIVDTGWTNPTAAPISLFQTTWVVPPAPRDAREQTIFLFNGIVNGGDPYGILQPVLQWGVSAAGGGPYWSIASWYVRSDGLAFHTELLRVEVGDELVGVMKLERRCGALFDYLCSFEGVSGTTLPVERIAELVWANETLEAYGLSSCSEYPATGATSMRDIELRTSGAVPTLTWTCENLVVDCGQRAAVVVDGAAGGHVDLHYR